MGPCSRLPVEPFDFMGKTLVARACCTKKYQHPYVQHQKHLCYKSPKFKYQPDILIFAVKQNVFAQVNSRLEKNTLSNFESLTICVGTLRCKGSLNVNGCNFLLSLTN